VLSSNRSGVARAVEKMRRDMPVLDTIMHRRHSMRFLKWCEGQVIICGGECKSVGSD